ncbi:alkylhydroperoxidase domain protein [Dickeya lacustris]|uniref:Alkylhydroperoxidase domain protein n=1 Tax=Dickeya lacustris TaxID=2259638 RepID=A0ABY8G387_9GAMM|nr:alkylhydroperoxidase domain protein [Dickeya lacustris]WFN54408.1 alkylhydroperoxidase domain protein [Dickeya lacustris]
MTQPTVDIIAQLAQIAPDSALAQARAVREAATRHTQGSYDVLFSHPPQGNLSLALRFFIASHVSAWHDNPTLAQFYAGRLADFPTPARDEALTQALAHAERLTRHPVAATPAHLHELQQAGWSDDDIVTLSQLVAFVSFQSRLVVGLQQLTTAAPLVANTADVTAGHWHTEPLTHSNKTAPTAFTQGELGWEPWIAAKPLAAFSEEEQAVLARFGHTESDYFRLLGRNLPLLEQRTLTDKGIFYTSGGLPRSERELAATVVSKVNGCIYCASVHARKASQLSKQDDAVQRLLNVPPGGSLAAGQDPRWQAIITFAARLSATPAQVSSHDVDSLRAAGLDTPAILDLIQSTAFFAWANRLMLTLGEPFWPSH